MMEPYVSPSMQILCLPAFFRLVMLNQHLLNIKMTLEDADLQGSDTSGS